MDSDLARRQGTQVAHSLTMVGQLPGFVDDATYPVGLRVAAIDAFFVHLRLVIEFLIKPSDPRAISRHDYASDFHLPTDLRARLNNDFDFASRHVAHLNRERVPTEDAPIVEPV